MFKAFSHLRGFFISDFVGSSFEACGSDVETFGDGDYYGNGGGDSWTNTKNNFPYSSGPGEGAYGDGDGKGIYYYFTIEEANE